MLLSLAIKKSKINSSKVEDNLEVSIKDYLRDKIKKNIFMDIHSIEKNEENYLVIASVEIDNIKYHKTV